jgi:hypothetical protein
MPVLGTWVNRDKKTGLAMVRAMIVEVEPKARSEVLCRALELQEGGEKPCTRHVGSTLRGVGLSFCRNYVPNF